MAVSNAYQHCDGLLLTFLPRYNEEKRLAERHLYFDVDKLCDIVAQSVGQTSEDILFFTKFAEGGSYRVFDILFKNRRNVVVRLPYPCTIPRGYGVASEVATVEYLRSQGVPIPKVLGWSATTTDLLGCEYIIMEKARGKLLDETWYTMDVEKRKHLMEKIVDVETRLFEIRLPACGSLYFRDSLPMDVGQSAVDVPGHEGFCIGPSAEAMWWYHGRDEVQANRGPWRSTLDLLTAVGQRELQWLHKFGRPRYPCEPLYRELYSDRKVDPTTQIANLEDYVQVARYLVPPRDDLNLPTLRHPDLSPRNIFINDDASEITAIIDWERTAILPAFIHTRVPPHFANFGDEASENFTFPTLPQGFSSLPPEQQEEETERFRRRHVYDAAAQPWEGDSTSLKAQIVNMARNWGGIGTAPGIAGEKPTEFPIQYTEAESEACLARDAEQKAIDAQMEKFRDHFGCNIDGWVPADMYADARQKVDDMKGHMLGIAETQDEREDIDQNWPFQDHEEEP
ncbi:hypothetical protein FQN51_004094 [Onygenales sp. PD_10]|nr:hypothetical protein FQN51_004094 [Onygenales sp. PD_10]